MAIVGFVGNKNAIESQLREENKEYYDKFNEYYSQLESNYIEGFNNIGNQYGSQIAKVGVAGAVAGAQNMSSYNQQLIKAYDSFLSGKESIDQTALGVGYKNLLYEENKQIMNNAFDSYRQRYLDSKSSIESGVASDIYGLMSNEESAKSALTKEYASTVEELNKQVEELDTSISNYAQNFVNYTDAHYGYLSWLYKKNEDAFSDPMLARFLNENGELVGTGQISAGIYDENGNLTDYGKDFFNFIETANYGGYTFGDYLADTNNKLFEWGASGGAERFQESIGFTGDYVPSKNTLSEGQFNSLYDKQSATYTDLVSKRDAALDDDDNANTYMNTLKDDVNSLIAFAKAAGVYDKVKGMAENLLNDIKGYSDSDKYEWAVTNSFADYEELYNLVMLNRGKDITVNAGERKANYDLVDEQITDLETKGLTGDEYIAEANRILKNYGTFSDFEIGGWGPSGNGGVFTMNYDTSTAGSEGAKLSYSLSDRIAGPGEFIELPNTSHTYYDAQNKRDVTVAIGRIGNTPVIRVNGVYYKLSTVNNTSDNRAFMLYLSSFDSSKRTNVRTSDRTKRDNE